MAKRRLKKAISLGSPSKDTNVAKKIDKKVEKNMPKRRLKKAISSGLPTKDSNVGKKIDEVEKDDKTSTEAFTPTSLNPPSTSTANDALTSPHALATSSSKAIENKKKDNVQEERKDKDSEKEVKGKRKYKDDEDAKSKRKDMGGEQSAGFIFMCNTKTKPECYQHRVFGLPRGKIEVVEKIKVGAKLFLYDFDLKLLYGIYKATSDGRLNVERHAFRGSFPAQVRFEIYKDCVPLPEKSFREAIKENYDGGTRFRQELSSKQVRKLISLFRPITVQSHASHPRSVHAASSSLLPTTRLQEVYQPPARPPPEDSYLSGVHHGQSEHILTYPLLGTQVGYAQPPLEPRHVVLEASPHHIESHYLTESRQPYLSDRVLFSAQDSYRRYRVAADTGRMEQVIGYETSHAPLQSHTLAPLSYAPPAYAQMELAPTHQPLYQGHGYADALQRPDARAFTSMVENNVPVSARYSFAGATPRHR